ncbi:dTMP kinase [Candidatus Saccharibacteria bacterium 49-20]|nr:MAG: dTMP kinase [Candidatus Saccharibacteria bacterium 49-20]
MGAAKKLTGWYSRIEGPDGAGKTSVLNLAREYAEEHNIPVLFIREPGTGEFGELMRDLLLHNKKYDLSPQTEYALLTANRTHLVSDVIVPALEKGTIVISDRGIESSIAMQGGAAGAITAKAKGKFDSLSTDDIVEIGARVLPSYYMQPNGLVLLSLSKKERQARMKAKAATQGLDKIEQRTLEYSDAVHDGYIALESLPHATVINAEQQLEEVWRQARPILFGPDHA